MIKDIMRDPIFLSKKSETATINDINIARDLLETLIVNQNACVGMAANMIGVKKNIIVFNNNGMYMTMFNPEIISKSGEYDTEEGCLSLFGVRKAKRYRNITVKYQDFTFKTCQESFSGWTAQIIQHEIDHCNGILI